MTGSFLLALGLRLRRWARFARMFVHILSIELITYLNPNQFRGGMLL